MAHILSSDNTKIYYKINKQSKLNNTKSTHKNSKQVSKPYLIFLHGWVNNWTTWKNEIEYFQKKGYKTLTLDLRGHGKSQKPSDPKKYKLSVFAKDIEEIITKENISDFILIGHSMGGMIALKYIELFQKIKPAQALIISSSTSKKIIDEKIIKTISPFIKQVLEYIQKHPEINKKYFKHINNLDLSQYKNQPGFYVFYKGLHNTSLNSVFSCLSSMFEFNTDNILKKINIPTLILTGENDMVIPKKHSIKLQKNIPTSELHIIKNGKHSITIDNPEKIIQKIERFLKNNDLINL
jgi:proline-specific peptidase